MRMNLDCDKNEFLLVDENDGTSVTLRYFDHRVDIAVPAKQIDSGYMTIRQAAWLVKAITKMLDRSEFIVANCKLMNTQQLAREVLGTDF